MEDYLNIYHTLITQVEHEVIEFKAAENQYDKDKLGKYFSALSNEANLHNMDFAWIVMGVDNNRKPIGTSFLMDESKRQLRYLLDIIKKDGIIFPDGLRWKSIEYKREENKIG